MKIYASWFDKLLESIFCILLVVEVFSLQKVFKLLEVAVVGRHRGRGQVNTADEAKFCSPICSTFWLNIVWTLHDVQHWLNINFLTEALIVSCMVGCCHGEESNPFIAVGLVAHTIKNLPAMQETGFRSLRREHPQKEMATHSSILAWEIPQTDEPGGL